MADANRQNYTSLEKAVLAECVLKYRHIIENKVTNSVTNKEKKKNTWDLIEKEFNSIPEVTVRTATQLYNCYRNLKRKATKRKAEERIELFRTGGGPAVTNENDNIDETLFAMGAITRPLENVYDSDHLYHMQTSYSDEYTISNCEIDADDLKRANLGNGSKEMNEIRHEQQGPNLDFVTQVKATDSPFTGIRKSKRQNVFTNGRNEG
ncbi:myb/SANT-like DNA-binding domain-containing protein 3 [Stegodyphus dumicola]|uniref:myb/SANT-like DNA-binding domain-containing protein 3 n=1 Tax=Stegodyphus dumicola TaxID=202533 RepID=UPI0015B24EF7|nr:myb/SANT-like DNA-binding domain-containing protein 3 [Stegodyphus dumicola]